MMKYLRSGSPPLMALGGIGLMAFGVMQPLVGIPPIPGIDPLTTIGGGFALFTAAFGVPPSAEAKSAEPEVQEPNDKPSPGTTESVHTQNQAWEAPRASTSEGRLPYELRAENSVAQATGTELTAFGIVSICGTIIAVASLLQGSAIPAFLILGVISFVGFNRFFGSDRMLR